MAPTKSRTPSADSEGMFAGMVVYLIESGVQARRLQIWKQKLVQMGATIEDHLTKRVTDIFAMTADALHQQLDGNRLARFKGVLQIRREMIYKEDNKSSKSSNTNNCNSHTDIKT